MRMFYRVARHLRGVGRDLPSLHVHTAWASKQTRWWESEALDVEDHKQTVFQYQLLRHEDYRLPREMGVQCSVGKVF